MAREFFDGTTGLADLLPYDYPAEDGVIVGKGELREHMAAFMVRGCDLDFSTAGRLNALAYRFNEALKRFGSGWMIQMDTVRGHALGYPEEGAFPDPVTQEIDARRRAAYNAEGAHFESTTVITVTFQPENAMVSRVSRALYQGGEEESPKADLDEETLVRFQKVMEDLEGDLGAIFESVVRLRRRVVNSPDGREILVDDQLAYIGFAVTGHRHPIRVIPDAVFVPLRFLLASENFVGGNTPRLGKRWIAPLVITGFPAEGIPGMLGALNSLPLQYRWSTRFIPLDPEVAKKGIKKLVKKWRQLERGMKDQVTENRNGIIDADAVAMAGDATSAYGLASGQAVRFGYYSSTIVLMDENQARLIELAGEVAKMIRNLGFQVREEFGDSSDNAVEAWLGTLPGVSFANIRKPMVHSLNLAHLLPTTGTWSGLEGCPHVRAYGVGAPPLMLAITSGNTPCRVTHHDADVGHTAIFGPTGAGKSTLLATMTAQHFRYPGARFFGFDKGYSQYALCAGMEGGYYELGGSDSLNFAPLADVDDPLESEWAKDWLELCVLMQGVVVDSRKRSDIDRAVYAMSKTPRSRRTMSHLAAMIEDPELFQALRQYTHDAGHTILDGDDDTISSNRMQIFETSELLERGKPQVVPVMMYCFHRVQRMLDGKPTVISLDEGWTYLDGDYQEARLKKWLKELRKHETSVWFATQHIADAMSSGIGAVVIDSCPTKFFCANPDAGQPDVRDHYTRMGLNHVEIARLGKASKQRDYYFKTTSGSRMIQLGLDPYALAYVGKAGKPVVDRIKELQARFGRDWTIEWERECGVQRRFAGLRQNAA